MFYTTSLSLYEKNADPGEYIFNDVTEHLWPRYVWYGTDSWHFNLPKFIDAKYWDLNLCKYMIKQNKKYILPINKN